MSYKRNQVELAIARIFDANCQEPSSELHTRIKRLLELDRSLGRQVRSKAAEEANFAFFTHEGPGTGADIFFSQYEAFALLNALRIMDHGWPQSFAVSTMRRVRPDLEKEHARILKQCSDELFNLQAIRAKARPRDIAVDNSDPVFLTLASKTQHTLDKPRRSPVTAVCYGFYKVSRFSRDVGASSMTMFEVATLVHRLHERLMQIEPKRRGRG